MKLEKMVKDLESMGFEVADCKSGVISIYGEEGTAYLFKGEKKPFTIEGDFTIEQLETIIMLAKEYCK